MVPQGVVIEDRPMTMDVHALLEQRAERFLGDAFDALVRRAGSGCTGRWKRPRDREAMATPGERGLEDIVDEWRDDAKTQ